MSLLLWSYDCAWFARRLFTQSDCYVNSTLSPFSQNGQALRMQTMRSSLSRINRLISFFTIKLLSAALLLFMWRMRNNSLFPSPPFFSLVHGAQCRHSLLYETWPVFSLSLFRCYNINENIFLSKGTSYYWRQNWALDEDSKKGFTFAVGRSQAEIFKLLLFCLIWSEK